MRKLMLLAAIMSMATACESGAQKKDDTKTAKADTKAKDKAGAKGDEKGGAPDAPAANASDPAAIVASMKAFSEGDLDGCLAAFHDDLSWNAIGQPNMPIMGKDAVKKDWEAFRAGFPDVKIVPTRIVDAGDVVAIQFVSAGTNTGDFMGMPATKKAFGMNELMIATRKDGKLHTVTNIGDGGAMMAQLGLAKDAPPSTPVALPTGEPEIITGEAADPAGLAAAKEWYTTFATATAAENMKKISAEDVIGHDTSTGETLTGVEANAKSMEGFAAAFPDFKASSAEVFAAGNYVLATTIGTGTHSGDMGPIKATGKTATLTYGEVCRMEGGKFKECWGYMNSMDMMGQLGLLPPPPAVAQK